VKRLLGIGALATCILLAGVADAALVKVGKLILRADGGFTPRTLPRRAFAPIDFKGHADLTATDGSVPPALQQALIDFDRDGRLSTAGLAVCEPSQLEEVTPEEARGRCPSAIVGSGHVEALISRESGPPVKVGSLLTLFNGPRQEGKPTVILHARTTVPAVQNYVIVVPIERRRGGFAYRATIDVPPIAAGRGALVHLDVKVGKRYRFRGAKRSYTSARCADGILQTHGHFTFADGTIIAGSVEKACIVR
jgi:hypothetical protein